MTFVHDVSPEVEYNLELDIFYGLFYSDAPTGAQSRIVPYYPPFATPAGVSTWGASHLMPLPGQDRSIFLRTRG